MKKKIIEDGVSSILKTAHTEIEASRRIEIISGPNLPDGIRCTRAPMVCFDKHVRTAQFECVDGGAMDCNFSINVSVSIDKVSVSE